MYEYKASADTLKYLIGAVWGKFWFKALKKQGESNFQHAPNASYWPGRDNVQYG